ncbi:MAG: fluoride efflux transporter CrcB [Pseudomonadota bacterium]
MSTLLSVAAGGAIGASARYLLGIGMMRLMGLNFPWGTLAANILGCFLMGVLIELMALKLTIHQDLRAFLALGVLGGFTTFSSFSADFANLLARNDYMSAAFYLFASVVISIAALFAGLALVRAL